MKFLSNDDIYMIALTELFGFWLQVFFLHTVNLLIGATIGLFFCIAVLYKVEMFRLGKA